jgi:hypothetical protein
MTRTHIDGLFSVRLLYDSDGGVGDEDQEDDERFDKCRGPAPTGFAAILETGEDERDDCGTEEDEDELILELSKDQGEQRRGRFFRKNYITRERTV